MLTTLAIVVFEVLAIDRPAFLTQDQSFAIPQDRKVANDRITTVGTKMRSMTTIDDVRTALDIRGIIITENTFDHDRDLLVRVEVVREMVVDVVRTTELVDMAVEVAEVEVAVVRLRDRPESWWTISCDARGIIHIYHYFHYFDSK